MDIYYTILVIFIMIILGRYIIIPKCNDMLTYNPYRATRDEMEKFCKKYKSHVKNIKFESKDGTILSGILINRIKEPNWNDDNIFMYCHGNSHWIGKIYGSAPIKMLSRIGTIFMFDYRGYGVSEGHVSEQGLYNDTMSAWLYMTQTMKIPANKIILYGRSLGTAISSNLFLNLLKQNSNLPKALIIESPFTTLNEIAENYVPLLTHIVVLKFNNLHNLKTIKKILKKKNIRVPICIFHSKDDELIPYKQAIKLSNIGRCELIDITGTHGHPIYNDDAINFIKNVMNNKKVDNLNIL